MRPTELIHAAYVVDRRAHVLARHLERALPAGARVLDVGCGDGRIASLVVAARPDLEITGVDVLVRPDARIRVESFDGGTIPYPDASFDAVMLVDVLHHADSPLALLQEAVRVAARDVIVKDVAAQTRLDHAILGFMDCVGNERFGVALPYAFWSPAEWNDAFDGCHVRVARSNRKLGLYPPPASWIFERSLHFVAVLEPVGGG